MGLIKTSGIVLKTTKYGDTSLIVTVLTRDFGKISAIAQGGRTNRSKMLAGLQLFSFSEIVMYKAKSKAGLYHLDEMTVSEGFSSIRADLDKMAYASYFADVCIGTATEDSDESEMLGLLLNTLYALDKDICDYEKIKTVFEWRLAAIEGYAPQLDACGCCGENEEIYGLSCKEGSVFCKKCAMGLNGIAQLSSGMVKIIEYITGCEAKKIFAFETNQKTVNYLSRISEGYISIQLDREFKTLDYLKKVRALGETVNAEKN